MTNDKTPTRAEKLINWISLWLARVALAVAAFAGVAFFLPSQQIDDVIVYTFSALIDFYLLKEVL